MQTATLERGLDGPTRTSQEYQQFFSDFDREVTKTSIPAGYRAPVSSWLEKGILRERVRAGKLECLIVGAPLSYDTPVSDFTGKVRFLMHRGDMLIERIAFHDVECAKEEVADLIEKHENIFFELWEEKPLCRTIVEHFGLKWICTKILQTDELVGVYGRHLPTFSSQYDQCEMLSLKRLAIGRLDVSGCVPALGRVPVYIDHYSMCNKEHTWSGVSLRGYGSLPEFISKPSEMSEEWKNANVEKLSWTICDTPLRAKLPEFEPLIDAIPGRKDRIRLTRLKPGGGEIYRHTDIQDRDAGVDEGKLMRIHIPIITNGNVKFESWNLRGVGEMNHMAVGEAWYMDVRKPHRVENYGDTDRIHLVIDSESNEPLKRLISRCSVVFSCS